MFLQIRQAWECLVAELALVGRVFGRAERERRLCVCVTGLRRLGRRRRRRRLRRRRRPRTTCRASHAAQCLCNKKTRVTEMYRGMNEIIHFSKFMCEKQMKQGTTLL